MEITPQQMTYIRHASAAVILDAYDRGIQRDYFVKVLNAAFNFNERARQWEFALGVLSDAQAQKLTLGKIQEACDKLKAKSDENRLEVLKFMKAIAAMPLLDDTIN